MGNSATSPPSTPLNYQPLAMPVTHAEREDYIKQNGGKKANERRLLTLVFLAVIMGLLLSDKLLTGGSKGALGGAVWFVITLVAFSFWYRNLYRDETNAVRAIKFAGANSFSFLPGPISIDQSGMLWQRGQGRHEVQVLVGSYANRPFQCGTHVYVTSGGRSQQTSYVSFMRVTLPRELPHILIDAHRNVLDLGGGLDKSQRLSLEGDFDEYFTVYCPDGYQQDTLYFLTPELMQSMIDQDRAYDMEVVGNQLYFYRSGRLEYDEATTRHLFQMLQNTGGEFVQNTRLYKDDRVSVSGSIAPEGMQLKRRVTAAQIIVFTLMIVYFLAIGALSSKH